MDDVIAHLFIRAILIGAKPAAATSGSDFAPLWPLLGVVLGGLISSLTAFFVNGRSNKQQLKRDQAAYKQQLERDQAAYQQQRDRDELTYTQQKERERIAYERSLRDAKRDRLRGAYKILLKADEVYIYVLTELEYFKDETEEKRDQRLTVLFSEALSGVNEAMIEILLEDLGGDIETIFSELRQAFDRYTSSLGANRMYSAPVVAQEDLSRAKTKAIQNRNKLLDLMQSHLKEVER